MEHLQKRGYKYSQIQREITKAKLVPRDQALQPSRLKQKVHQGIPFVVMHQPIPAAPDLHPPIYRADPWALAFFWPWMANSWRWGLLTCQVPRSRDEKKRTNAPSSVNTATFFTDRTVE